MAVSLHRSHRPHVRRGGGRGAARAGVAQEVPAGAGRAVPAGAPAAWGRGRRTAERDAPRSCRAPCNRVRAGQRAAQVGGCTPRTSICCAAAGQPLAATRLE
eukprot:43895-Chlamydomonas_euryale.AAC.7